MRYPQKLKHAIMEMLDNGYRFSKCQYVSLDTLSFTYAHQYDFVISSMEGKAPEEVILRMTAPEKFCWDAHYFDLHKYYEKLFDFVGSKILTEKDVLDSIING